MQNSHKRMKLSESSARSHKQKSVKKVKPVEKSRKEQRKERRKLKKLARAAYFQKNKELRSKDGPILDRDQSESVAGKDDDRYNKDRALKLEGKRRERKKEPKSKNCIEKQRKSLLKEANLKEDKIIKKLEKQLKLNKRKKKTISKTFVADGLDYLLDLCKEESRKQIVETERQLLENEFDTKFQKDLTLVTEETIFEKRQDNEDYTNSKKTSSTDEDVDERSAEKSESLSSETDFSEDEESNILEDVKSEKTKLEHSLSCKDKNLSTSTDIWEDIYGRKRDKEGNVIQVGKKYVPPHVLATAQTITVDKKMIQLRKRLKGCINRVAEHNIHTIANQMDELYMTHSRNDMNDTLSKLMIDAIVSPVLTPDRLVSEHMMLIAILHANVGIEVGAHFLETLVQKLNKMMSIPQDVENKELDNVILMLSHLYNFKVYGHKLLYQILERLASKFMEKEIELILLVLKTVGFLLRKDDPNALKDFMQNLQQKICLEKSENSRVKFMLSVLLAIKNNNVSKIPQYDPSHVDHLRKVIKNVIRKGNVIMRFNVSLEDLLHAEERGKWWVVGSAWSGTDNAGNETMAKCSNELVFGEKILELARKQRMNTDARRNIFCVLMTAEDYLDAFEKLHHLGLKDQQEREVIHVLMHCCLQEKQYNPYYAVLAHKLCDYDRKYQLTIQYALWDKLESLQTYDSKRLSNLAKFLTHMFVESSLAFSILKVIQFTELNRPTTRLLRQIILGVLLHKSEEACLRVFERIAISPRLQHFRESLRLFVNHFLVKNIEEGTSVEKEITLRRRAELMDKILASKGNRVVF